MQKLTIDLQDDYTSKFVKEGNTESELKVENS